MDTKILEKIYAWFLLVIMAGIVVHAPLTVWFSSLAPDDEAIFRAWKEIIMLMTVSIALLLMTKKGLWAQIWNDWLFRCIIIFTSIHIAMMAVFWNGPAPTFAGLAIDLRFMLYFSLVYILIRLAPRYRKTFLKVALVGGLIVGAFALLQVTVLPRDVLSHIGYNDQTIAPYLTVDNDPDYVRINSTLRGPNPLGAYMVILLSLVLAFAIKHFDKASRRRRVIAIFLAVCGVLGLWASYSRSALIAMVASVPIVVGAARAHLLSRRNWIVIGVVLFAIVGSLVMTKGAEFASQVILHENPDGGSSVSSNDQHLLSLYIGVTRMAHQPLGAGIGSTGSASMYGASPLIIENQYLFIAHEVGWVGLAFFAFIFLIILSRLWNKREDWLALGLFASGVGLAFIGILLPVWVDDTVSIVWWGLAAIALAGRRHDGF
jgi:hypothetical protein